MVSSAFVDVVESDGPLKHIRNNNDQDVMVNDGQVHKMQLLKRWRDQLNCEQQRVLSSFHLRWLIIVNASV